MTGNEKYWQWARRIGDFYLCTAIPQNNYFPLYDVDPAAKSSRKKRCKLRDHGNEIIPGLVELYVIEAVKKGDREPIYYPPLKQMLEKLLRTGRNEHGMWYYALDVATEQPLKQRLCDNWGYLYAAYYTFYYVCEQTHRGDPADRKQYLDAIPKTLSNLCHYQSFDWGDLHYDGYADAIEGALYVLNRLPSDDGFAWVDNEIQTLFVKQSPRGFIDGTYLEGNFIRTLLLYAFWKTQGTYITPWRQDVFFGACRDGATLWVHLETKEPWQGTLMFDTPRHRNHLGLPFNYARINEWPEWFVVDATKNYRVTDQTLGESRIVSGADLQKGIEVTLGDFSAVDLIIEQH